jgi:Tfp pilus assembly protein PilN
VIKINLKPSAGAGNALVGGLDISKIDFKKLLIGVLVYFILDIGPGFYFDSVTEGLNKQIAKKNKELKEIQKKLGEYKNLSDKVQALQSEKAGLDERFNVVKKIINQRVSPMKIMQYIAQNIPKDLWITKLEIKENKLAIEGNSVTYKSIGLFIGSLKKSIFFDQNVNLDNYETKNNEGQRLENFKLSAKVIRYE